MSICDRGSMDDPIIYLLKARLSIKWVCFQWVNSANKVKYRFGKGTSKLYVYIDHQRYP